MAKPTFYWKSTCTSCRDARATLREQEISFDEVNYTKTGLDAATVESLIEVCGSVEPLINQKHAVAKEKGWATEAPAPRTFAQAVAAEPNLIRRPIFVRGKKVLVGFDKKTREAWSKLRTT